MHTLFGFMIAVSIWICRANEYDSHCHWNVIVTTNVESEIRWLPDTSLSEMEYVNFFASPPDITDANLTDLTTVLLCSFSVLLFMQFSSCSGYFYNIYLTFVM